MFQVRPAAPEEPRDGDASPRHRHSLHTVTTLPPVRGGVEEGGEGEGGEGEGEGESVPLQDPGPRGRADGGGEGGAGHEGELPHV